MVQNFKVVVRIQKIFKIAAEIRKINYFSEALYPGSIVSNGSKICLKSLKITLKVFEKINIFTLCKKAAIGVAVESQSHKAIGLEALPIHTHISYVLKILHMKCQNEETPQN